MEVPPVRANKPPKPCGHGLQVGHGNSSLESRVGRISTWVPPHVAQCTISVSPTPAKLTEGCRNVK